MREGVEPRSMHELTNTPFSAMLNFDHAQGVESRTMHELTDTSFSCLATTRLRGTPHLETFKRSPLYCATLVFSISCGGQNQPPSEPNLPFVCGIQVAEATAAAGNLVRRAALDQPEEKVQTLQGYVVAIPTMNAVHGQDTWQGVHVSLQYGDHAAWDVNLIVEILGKFFKASQGFSLPDLAEYQWRLDKVRLLHTVSWLQKKRQPGRTLGGTLGSLAQEGRTWVVSATL